MKKKVLLTNSQESSLNTVIHSYTGQNQGEGKSQFWQLLLDRACLLDMRKGAGLPAWVNFLN